MIDRTTLGLLARAVARSSLPSLKQKLVQLPGATRPRIYKAEQSFKENIMTSQVPKYYVGIDVSKDMLDLFILPQQKRMQFKNQTIDIKKLVKKLSGFPGAHIILEATGGYEKPVAHALTQAFMPVSIVNPRRIRDFAKALGQLAKTDQIDARIIALFGEKIQPQAKVVYHENQQQLAENNARRRQLIDMITMEKNRLAKVSDPLKKSIKRVLDTLEKELQSITQAQEQAIQQDAAGAQKSALLQSVKGVGTIIAAALIADLPELGRLSHKEITALAGLAPYNRDSGTLKGKRTIWGGRASVRCSLYMAALVAIRHNAPITAFYQRLCQAGKAKKAAIVACMRKLLIVMNAMIRNNQPWQPKLVNVI